MWDDKVEPDYKPWFPPEPIYYPEWKEENVVRQNTTQEYDPERPIPYIVDLSADGMLLIGWDRDMRPPQNFSDIPPTKIAVEEGVDLEKFRFYEHRRKL